MPIEIKELQIKINVTESSANDATSQGSGGGASHGTNQSVEDKEALLQECVEKVLEILKNKVER